MDISFTVCLFADFSGEDKASGVQFCMVVHRRPGQGISHFVELCSPEAQKWTNRPPPGTIAWGVYIYIITPPWPTTESIVILIHDYYYGKAHTLA